MVKQICHDPEPRGPADNPLYHAEPPDISSNANSDSLEDTANLLNSGEVS